MFNSVYRSARLAGMSLGIALAVTAAQADERFITVTGEGSVQVAPDMATLQLGVVAQAKTAAEAVNEMSAAATDVLKALQGAGIPAADIQTAVLDLRPLRQNSATQPQSRPEITGFEVETQLSIRTTDLAGLGGLFDLVLKAGANQINGVNFALEDTENTLNEARQAAVADALEKARLYADAAGVTLGPIQQISEPGATARPEMSGRMFAMDASMPVAAGSLRLGAQVTVVFAIGD